MAASDHLSSAQFFYGTNAELEPGSYLSPKGANDYGRLEDESSRGHVYFTADRYQAYGYALRAQQQRGGNANVYQVQPTGKTEADPMDEYDSGRTRTRLRVTGKADV
jgi:hypothetical protein